MVWNYRIVRTESGLDDLLEIREVYYRDDGTPFGHGNAALLNETEHGTEGVRSVLDMMRAALDKPILEAGDFVAMSDGDGAARRPGP